VIAMIAAREPAQRNSADQTGKRRMARGTTVTGPTVSTVTGRCATARAPGRQHFGHLQTVADPPTHPQDPIAAGVDARQKLASTFASVAEVLEQSAQLAEDEGHRRARRGQPELAAIESRHADQARVAARTARAHAQRLRNAPLR
jgi:hypothetical protein